MGPGLDWSQSLFYFGPAEILQPTFGDKFHRTHHHHNWQVDGSLWCARQGVRRHRRKDQIINLIRCTNSSSQIIRVLNHNHHQFHHHPHPPHHSCNVKCSECTVGKVISSIASYVRTHHLKLLAYTRIIWITINFITIPILLITVGNDRGSECTVGKITSSIWSDV